MKIAFNFLSILMFLSSIGSWQQVHAQNKKKSPNFIFILSDDQGWNGTSVQMMNNEPLSKSDYYETPNLVKLANRGMRFSNGYAPAAECAPSRYSLQYGQTPARLQMVRVYMNTDHINHGNMLTIPKMLKQINPAYQAAHFGKWNINAKPEVLGYDESDGLTDNADGDFAGKDKWNEFKISDDPKNIFSVTKRSTDFITRQVKAGKPFYLQVSHYAIHADFVMRQQTLDKYKAKKPGTVHENAYLAAMTEDLDASVGMLMDKVKELGIEGETYIIYLADNGAVAKVPPYAPYINSYNYPLSRGKMDLTEGGIRVPFIVAGPGIKAGSESKVPVVGYDILPTLASLTGFTGKLSENLDGGSFKDILTHAGKGSVKRNEEALYFHIPQVNLRELNRAHSVARQGNYKLLKFADNGELWLFDLDKDIQEKNNLASQMPQKAKQLESLLDNYLVKVHAPKWKKGINWTKSFKEQDSVY